MARGRIVANKIVKNRQVNDLSDDTCRLLFTWLLTFADCEGRTYGDPSIVRSTVFPRRENITVDQVEKYLQELHAAGLIVLYVADGDQYVFFPKFEENQKGMRKDREPQSEIPAPTILVQPEMQDEQQDDDKTTPQDENDEGGEIPPHENSSGGELPDVCRMSAGCLPAEENGMEWNGMEEKGSCAAGAPRNKPLRDPIDDMLKGPPANDATWLPAHLVEIGKEFLENSGVKPTTRERKGWIAAFEDIYLSGAEAGDVTEAIRLMRKENLTIGGPFSIFKTVRDLASKRNAPVLRSKNTVTRYDAQGNAREFEA